MLDSVIFYFFASIAVISAALMVTRRNAIHSAVFLITTLLATAGIFLQLRAEFLFISQIILYVGGIMVLFIFVIMLVRLNVPLPQIRSRTQKWIALLVALAVGVEAGFLHDPRHRRGFPGRQSGHQDRNRGPHRQHRVGCHQHALVPGASGSGAGLSREQGTARDRR